MIKNLAQCIEVAKAHSVKFKLSSERIAKLSLRPCLNQRLLQKYTSVVNRLHRCYSYG